MPVLIVSLNTWPHVGFSRNRSIVPSSWVMTMPNSSGFSTGVRPIVATRLLLVVEREHLVEVDVGEHVAGDDEERLVEQVAGVADAAGRAERHRLVGVGHRDAELAAVAEVGLDVVGQERDRDDDLVEPVLLQQADDVLHHRPVGERQHRLRRVRGERAQPGALAAGHDDGLHGKARPTLTLGVDARPSFAQVAADASGRT